MLTLATGVDAMLSIKEVADRLDVSVMTIRRLVWSGALRAYKIGGRLKFEPEDVEAYRAQQVYRPEDKGDEHE
jgi:excisionase family DNA binding protein